MAQLDKDTTKPGDLSLLLETNMVGRKNWLQKTFFWHLHAPQNKTDKQFFKKLKPYSWEPTSALDGVLSISKLHVIPREP